MAPGGGGRSQWSQLRSRKVRQSKLKDLLSLSLTEQKIGKKAKKFGRIQVLYLSREWAPFILPSFRGASAASFVLAAPAASVGLYPVSRPRGPSWRRARRYCRRNVPAKSPFSCFSVQSLALWFLNPLNCQWPQVTLSSWSQALCSGEVSFSNMKWACVWIFMRSWICTHTHMKTGE